MVRTSQYRYTRNDGEARDLQALGDNATFSVEDLKSRKFALCGHAESKAKCDQNIVARIESSQAIDKARK